VSRRPTRPIPTAKDLAAAYRQLLGYSGALEPVVHRQMID
jgi:hypothetical protein